MRVIELLEEENRKLKIRLDLAIDMMVLNHECFLCPVGNDCEVGFVVNRDAEDIIKCRQEIKSFFDSIDR
jgi:hypothetical protein